MKQTLFEAEAVLSVNTDKMFADLEKAAKDAKRRLESILGGITAPTIGGGRGGSGGGGGGSGGGSRGKGSYFSEQMALAQGEKAAGQYGASIRRLTSLMDNYKLSVVQMARAQNALEAAERKQMAVQARTVRASERAVQKASSTNQAAGPSSRINPFGDQMALANGEKAAGRYADAITRLTNLQNTNNLTSAQAVRVQNALDAVERKRMATINRAIQKGEKAASQPGASSRINPFGDAMAEVRLLRNTQQYEQALIRIDQLLANQLTRRQRLSADTLRASVVQSQQNYNDGGGADPESRRRNAQVQNASFAIQDFAIVLSQGGGMGRALAAASNNLAFMASMMGTARGAAIGLGLTLAAVFAPAIAKAVFGIEDMGKKAEETAKRVDKLTRALERAAGFANTFQSVQGMLSQGDHQGLKNLEFQKQQEMEVTRDVVLPKTLDFKRTERKKAADDFIESLGVFSRNIPPEFIRKVESGEMSADDIRKLKKNAPWDVNAITGDSLTNLANRVEGADAPSNDAKATVSKLTDELELLAKNIKELNSVVADMPFGVFDDVKKRDDAAFNRRRLDEAFEKGGLEKSLPAKEQLFEALFPKEAEIEEIKKRWADSGMLGDPQAQAIMDYQISQVKNPSKGEFSGQVGGVDFANQLTGMLSKSDPQSKLTEFASKQTGYQEKMAADMKASRERLEQLTTSPFSGN